MNGTHDESQWWGAVMCFHDPKTHDWELYEELMKLSHMIILPITIAGLFVNCLALVSSYDQEPSELIIWSDHWTQDH